MVNNGPGVLKAITDDTYNNTGTNTVMERKNLDQNIVTFHQNVKGHLQEHRAANDILTELFYSVLRS
jgi:hypothetical protein